MLALRLTALVALLPAALGAAIAPRAPNEVIRFLHCNPDNVGQSYGIIFYCADSSNCPWPAGKDQCVVSKGEFTTTGATKSCRFASGVTLKFKIDYYARNPRDQDPPHGVIVGAGDNGYATYAITKGSGMDTYRDGNGYACRDAFNGRPI